MPTVARAFAGCVLKRKRYLKLSAYILSLGSGLVVAMLGYASLTRLNVLSVESQRWGLHGHQRHLAALAVATVVLGSACSLAAVLGCVDALLARRPHLTLGLLSGHGVWHYSVSKFLDIIAGVLILAQVGVASAGFTLMIWVQNDIPPGRTNCKGCLRNIIFVCGKLIPAIGSLLLASTVAQCTAIVVNRVDESQAEVQAKLDRANNLEEYKMNTMNHFIGQWAPRKSRSWGGDLDYSGSLFDHAGSAHSVYQGGWCGTIVPVSRRRESKGIVFNWRAPGTTPRTKLRFGAVSSPAASIRPPIEIVISEAPSEASGRATAAFQRDSQGAQGSLGLPDFANYANVE